MTVLHGIDQIVQTGGRSLQHAPPVRARTGLSAVLPNSGIVISGPVRVRGVVTSFKDSGFIGTAVEPDVADAAE